MPILARKIGLAKWTPKQGLTEDEVPADAVTSDLRTSGNTLSFWKSPGTSKEDLRAVVLALASASERLDKMDVTWIADSNIEQAGLQLKETEGHTPVRSLVKEHVDVVSLDLVRLGTVAELFHAAIQEERCYRYTKKEILNLLADAAQRGLLAVGDLSEKVSQEVRKLLN